MRRIIGPPGTGKTTRIVDITEKLVDDSNRRASGGDLPVMVLSMTRAAAAEVGKRELPIPRQAVSTIHAQGFRSLSADGYSGIAERNLKLWNEVHPDLHMSLSSDEPDDPLEGARAETDGDRMLAELTFQRSKLVPPEKYRKRFILAGHLGHKDLGWFEDRWDKFKTENSLIDFADMIDIPLAEVDVAPNNPHVILVDEAQDLSPAELALVRKWGENAPGGLVIVGDPYQALYEWRGADPDVFLRSEEGEAPEVLSQSYRVPREVHREALELIVDRHNFRRIDYQPRAADGECIPHGRYIHMPDDVVGDAVDCVSRGESAMIAASCGYMLDRAVAVMRHGGVPFSNPWAPKNGRWNPLGSGRGVSMRDRIFALLKMHIEPPGEEPEPDEFEFGHNAPDVAAEPPIWSYLDMWHIAQHLDAKLSMVRGSKKEIEAKKDIESMAHAPVSEVEIRRWFVEDAARLLCGAIGGMAGPDDLLRWWQNNLIERHKRTASYPLQIMRDHGAAALAEKPRLYVGTIHSFKGSEADNVFLFPDLSPRGIAAWDHNPVPTVRMFYVGMTRAKHRLYLCETSNKNNPEIW